MNQIIEFDIQITNRITTRNSNNDTNKASAVKSSTDAPQLQQQQQLQDTVQFTNTTTNKSQSSQTLQVNSNKTNNNDEYSCDEDSIRTSTFHSPIVSENNNTNKRSTKRNDVIFFSLWFEITHYFI